MGKRARLKKELKLAEVFQEKTSIEVRRKSRLAPTIRSLKKFVITTLATIFILWLGVFVTKHISTILLRLGGAS